jgi:hypothetical protein
MAASVPLKELKAVKRYLVKLLTVFQLDWDVAVADTYQDNGHTRAEIHPTPKIRTAVIYLGSDWDEITTDEEAGYCLLHEVLHIITADLCNYMQNGVIPELPPQVQELAWGVFDSYEEIAVDKLARVLYPLMPQFTS